MKTDLITKGAAVKAVLDWMDTHKKEVLHKQDVADVIMNLPAQLERDVPIKPMETTDRAWGIPARQAVCPKCDYYLGHVAFLGDYKGKRITFCETCGQAIDWEGWEFDE
ncbi:MAG: hypothetical protein ILP14_14070 [Oscillospiraceae bacterium]|nr:hypothetical protein [Oscillospiraceae bacterium]